jgi:hypothetical protein
MREPRRIVQVTWISLIIYTVGTAWMWERIWRGCLR